ncbi:MAG: (Fe-S)-binding protein [Actinomycetota bacterium]|nr:(Fe-S)-binding protein [Actinomycetota bacterium]
MWDAFPVFLPDLFYPRAVVQVLGQAEVDFGLLGDDEWCCGFPLLSAGMEKEARQLAANNVEKVKSKGARVLITSCPSCYHTFKHEYSQILGHDLGFEVMHISQYLLSLIREGKLKLGPVNKKLPIMIPVTWAEAPGSMRSPGKLLRLYPG